MAQISLSIASGRPLDKRRLRYELARSTSAEVLAGEMKKRLSAMMRSKSLITSDDQLAAQLREIDLHYKLIQELEQSSGVDAIETLFVLTDNLLHLMQRFCKSKEAKLISEIVRDNLKNNLKKDQFRYYEITSYLSEIIIKQRPSPEVIISGFLQQQHHGYYLLHVIEKVRHVLGKEGFQLLKQRLEAILEEYKAKTQGVQGMTTSGVVDTRPQIKQLEEIIKLLYLIQGRTKKFLSFPSSKRHCRSTNKFFYFYKHLSSFRLSYEIMESIIISSLPPTTSHLSKQWYELCSKLLYDLTGDLEKAAQIIRQYLSDVKTSDAVALYLKFCYSSADDGSISDAEREKALLCIKGDIINNFEFKAAVMACLEFKNYNRKCSFLFAQIFDKLMIQRISEASEVQSDIWDKFLSEPWWERYAPLGMLLLCRMLITNRLISKKSKGLSEAFITEVASLVKRSESCAALAFKKGVPHGLLSQEQFIDELGAKDARKMAVLEEALSHSQAWSTRPPTR